MNSGDPPIWTIIVGMIVVYGGLAALLLHLGSVLKRRFQSEQSNLWWGIHVTALFGLAIGGLVAWMGWSTDHPNKHIQLLVPLVFVALVYGVALRVHLGELLFWAWSRIRRAKPYER